VNNAFIDRLHDEALSLLLASRDCAAKGADANASGGDDPAERLAVTVASLGLAALVIDAVAWTLAQKAVAAGQLSVEEAAADRWTPVELTFDSAGAVPLPAPLAELVEKARLFHRRVVNLHQQSRRGIAE
jgi:regulator of CtrA degradation